ncbi:tellurite resistance TerB family protein [Methylobacterium sp. ID0610]|uniref:tellurite resistance TerB family protein n=1 Tax=Methylobacterium carpenticola TaxID=3344827 RepID=UPI0036746235
MADTRQLVDALVRSRRSGPGGLVASVALGGLALIAGLGYRALNRQEAEAPPAEAARQPFEAGEVSDDEASLFLRAMVAATLADGMIDAQERARLDAALAEAGLDETGRRGFEDLLRDPPDIDEIADRVSDPETAARVYAAARLAIDPDTVQERDFLNRLAAALDVEPDAIARVEAEVGA